MKFRWIVLLPAISCFAQEASAPSPSPVTPLLRSETRLVLVDAVVTDKKGNYIRDLTANDFRVWEDKKEQSIESFSFEAGAAANPNAQTRYLILFFDNSTMEFGDQVRARQAALKFIDSNAGPKRPIAVVNFGGSLQIAQNFTENREQLKQVVSGIKFSFVSPNPEVASLGAVSLGKAATEFGARDVLMALRTLAKNLSAVPGRKTLVFLSGGFPLTPELRSELTAVIDVCNKANVAVYSIDVRGLVAAKLRTPNMHPDGAFLELASYMQQRGAPPTGGGASNPRPPGGGAGTGTRGGAPSGNRGGTGTRGGNFNTGNRGMGQNTYGTQNSIVAPRNLVPTLPKVSVNQEVLYALASGTGGFVIENTNDLIGGLQKIGSEQNEYYVLGYTPPRTKEGACHELKMKVERGGTNVRSRSGYCDTKPQDLLAGSEVEKTLELRAATAAAGNVNATMEIPFFYTSPGTARVEVALDIAPNGLQFAKEKGKLHSEMNVLGIATESDGTIAARFSDTHEIRSGGQERAERVRTEANSL